MKYDTEKLEVVIDEKKAKLMDDTEKPVIDPSKAKLKLKPDNVNICYPPIFQSVGCLI